MTRKSPYYFTTSPLPCPYLPARAERKVVTEISGMKNAEKFYSDMAASNYRRSHNIIYTPTCTGCSECKSVRIVVDGFAPDRTMRKIIKTNTDLIVTRVKNVATKEQYGLFTRYQETRHTGGDMALMSFEDYRSMVEISPIETFLYEFRDANGHLIGVTLIDRLNDGFSGNYQFFEPSMDKRSLGTFAILWVIEELKRQNLPYFYLGFWVKGAQTMKYKTRFKPLEVCGSNGWQPLENEGD